jgi:hypothetical protein
MKGLKVMDVLLRSESIWSIILPTAKPGNQSNAHTNGLQAEHLQEAKLGPCLII